MLAMLAAVSVLGLAGCGKKAEPAPEVRPVRLMQLSPHNGKTAFEFSGDVRPRVESRLGFRVGGKIAARLVDVGAVVSKGQPLARLDPTGRAVAATPAMLMVGAAIGPVLGGTLVKAYGYPALGTAALVVDLVAAILFACVLAQRSRTGASGATVSQA